MCHVTEERLKELAKTSRHNTTADQIKLIIQLVWPAVIAAERVFRRSAVCGF